MTEFKNKKPEADKEHIRATSPLRRLAELLFRNGQQEERLHNIVFPTQQGTALAIEEMPDLVFSEKVLGDGICILPATNEVLSPVNGRVIFIADSLHAYGLEDEHGAELMLHLGIDTVELKGQGFSVQVEAGQTVRCGDLLCLMDIEAISHAGYKTHTALIITNTEQFAITKRHYGDTTSEKPLFEYLPRNGNNE